MDYVDFLNLEQIYYGIFLLLKKILHFLNPFNIAEAYYEAWPLLMTISLVLSFFLLWALLYIRGKFKKIKKENEKMYNTILTGSETINLGENKNNRWNKIIQQVNSDSASEWKIAILEADIILDEMLGRMGYRGDSIGEKLKQIERSDFLNLDNAWEAHKIRNRVAHQGEDFVLTSRIAKKAISSYQKVFEEFEYI